MPRNESKHYGHTQEWALHQRLVTSHNGHVPKYVVTKSEEGSHLVVFVRDKTRNKRKLPTPLDAIEPHVAREILADSRGPFNALVDTHQLTGEEFIEFAELMVRRSMADVGEAKGEAKDLRLLRAKAERERTQLHDNAFFQTLSIAEECSAQLARMCEDESLCIYSDKEVQRQASATAEALGGLINQLICKVGKLTRAIANDQRPCLPDVPVFGTMLAREGLLL